MNGAHTTTNPIFPGQPLPPGPFQDRYRRPLSPATVELLIQLQVLLVYARHLLGLLRQAAEWGVSLLARCFGPDQASFVLTHFSRGILRAIALQRVLSAHAAEDGQPNPAAGTPRKRTASQAQQNTPRPPSPPQNQRPTLPTLRQMEAAIRHRPLDSVIDDIGRELGTAFSLCEARFGNALRDMAAAYRDTLSRVFSTSVLNESHQREAVTADAPERVPTFAYPPQFRDAIRYIVGCLGAQQPVCGFPFNASPVGAATTGAQPP